MTSPSVAKTGHGQDQTRRVSSQTQEGSEGSTEGLVGIEAG